MSTEQQETKYGELSRLSFVESRDGLGGARIFARQGIVVYRKALAERSRKDHRTGYGLAYRRQLVESLLIYRRFLRSTA
jgi:hypothetical protein